MYTSMLSDVANADVNRVFVTKLLQGGVPLCSDMDVVNFCCLAVRAKGNTLHQYGRSAGWTEIRGLGKREMKSLYLSQRMAGLPSGPSEKDLNVQVSFTGRTVTLDCGHQHECLREERSVSFYALASYPVLTLPPEVRKDLSARIRSLQIRFRREVLFDNRTQTVTLLDFRVVVSV